MKDIIFFASGGLAIYLVGRSNPRTRFYGCICGMISQPFWIYKSIQAQSWPMIALSVWYSYAWLSGAINNFNENRYANESKKP